MAFTASSANGRVILSEDTALANAGAAYSANFIVAEGEDFTVFMNTGATDAATTLTCEVQGSWDGTSFIDVTSSFAAPGDAMAVGFYDVSTKGDFPYYRVKYTSGGNDSGKTATTKIVGNVKAA